MPLQEDHAFNAGSLIRGTNRADFIAESLCVSKKKENEREEQMNDTLEERGHRTVYTQMFPVHLFLSFSSTDSTLLQLLDQGSLLMFFICSNEGNEERKEMHSHLSLLFNLYPFMSSFLIP